VKTTIVAAMAQDNVIGINNTLPWDLPADLAHFKKITMGKPLLMGRKTYESIGRPLPGRVNIVLSRDSATKIPGCEVVDSIDKAYELAAKIGAEEIIIMGGENLYRQMLPQADKLEITLVDAKVQGDAWFPEINPDEWIEAARTRQTKDAANQYDYTFVTFLRRLQIKGD